MAISAADRWFSYYYWLDDAKAPNFARTVVYLIEHSETGALGLVLNRPGEVPVHEAADKDRIDVGHVYLAPADYHLLIDDGHFALSTEEAVRFSRPSIDVLLQSAADNYGGHWPAWPWSRL